MRGLAVFAALLLVSASAAAQPAPPECKSRPNGGSLTVEIPTVTVPPTCQVCSGPTIPANPVFGFSDGSHNTCELKTPTGGNSGVCRKDSTCPPGTSRVTRNNVVVCESGGGTRVIDCPVPPGAGSSGRPPAPGSAADARLMACATQLSAAEARLVQFQRQITSLRGDAEPPRPRIVPASFKAADAQVIELLIDPLINVLKTTLIAAFREAAETAPRKAVACAVTSPAPECVTARDTVRRGAERARAGAGAWSDAARNVRDQVNAIIEKGTPAARQVAAAVQKEVDAVSAEIAACVADLQRVER